jgi:hypothetical protein
MVVHTHVLAWAVYKAVAIRRRWVHILYTVIVLFSIKQLNHLQILIGNNRLPIVDLTEETLYPIIPLT